MAEMERYCGRRFRVFKRADRVCVERDYFLDYRRLRDAVLLEEVRCDGSAHDGCQRLCMIFWKEAWLEPAPPDAKPEPALDWSRLLPSESVAEIDESRTYSCQSTQLLGATEPLRVADPRSYARDLWSGALGPIDVAKVVMYIVYGKLQRIFTGTDFSFVRGTLTKTPRVSLGLTSGELVKVKRKDDIVATLDSVGRNRGLWFGYEMIRHCGRTLKVIGPVRRMILENNGKMKKINHTVLLQGGACSGICNRGCARYGHPLWREAWLERVDGAPASRP